MAIWRAVEGASTSRLDGRSVVTIGNFDGVHLGHQHVVARAAELAADLAEPALPVVAVTFSPHPLAVVAPDRAPLALTSPARRIALLREAGADHVFVLAFDTEMSGWSPEEFIQRVLVDDLHAAGLVVGENFRFGRGATGDVALLKRFGAEHDVVVEGLPLDGGDEDFSSTLVRRLLAAGDVGSAAQVLGRPFAVEGTVVTGDRRGRELGFPTANVPAPDGVATPADGVYAGFLVRVTGERLPAAISVGSNPTFDGVERRIESYVLDRTDLDVYGEAVRIDFVERLRGMERYETLEALVVQMQQDVAATRVALA